MDTKGHKGDKSLTANDAHSSNIVLDKSIFAKVFEKDIRRIYIYRKADRVAKALHLVGPAFKDSRALRERLEALTVSIIDASMKPLSESREALSRDLLSLLSFLSMARMRGTLSPMNVDIITKEAQALLQDINAYEDQRLMLPETPTLAELSKSAPRERVVKALMTGSKNDAEMSFKKTADKGQNKGHSSASGRRDSILSVLSSKGNADIKAISMVIRGVSEKTIQRELQGLVSEGLVIQTGKRRWTTYSLAKGG